MHHCHCAPRPKVPSSPFFYVKAEVPATLGISREALGPNIICVADALAVKVVRSSPEFERSRVVLHGQRLCSDDCLRVTAGIDVSKPRNFVVLVKEKASVEGAHSLRLRHLSKWMRS
jgi:hypothetical protein